MTEITPVGLSPLAPQAAVMQRLAAAPQGSGAGAAAATDRIELSTAATLVARMNALGDVRSELVHSIRQQILDGSYEHSLVLKIDLLLDRLGTDLVDL
jgi:anti-sigma28 factor (negative regulator of flagellin synthesis)